MNPNISLVREIKSKIEGDRPFPDIGYFIDCYKEWFELRNSRPCTDSEFGEALHEWKRLHKKENKEMTKITFKQFLFKQFLFIILFSALGGAGLNAALEYFLN